MSSQQLVNEANIIKNQSNLFLLRYSNMNFNLFFAFCLQLEKYQDIIKATEEFETKLVSFGVFQIVWFY